MEAFRQFTTDANTSVAVIGSGRLGTMVCAAKRRREPVDESSRMALPVARSPADLDAGVISAGLLQLPERPGAAGGLVLPHTGVLCQPPHA